MKTDYPQSGIINLFANTGIIICLLMTTILSVGFVKETEAGTSVMSSNQMQIEANYVTNEERLEAVRLAANENLEKGIEKIKAEEAARIKAEEERKSQIVYDGLTLDELSAKLEKSLNSTLSGQGYFFASYSVELGLDPYLALAITLHETGCKWNCSTLVRQCYNVGGMKGSPGCNGGSYKKFNTIDDGIKAYIDNLSANYYKKGLNTVEKINTKYASSKTWSAKINRYINEIKSK